MTQHTDEELERATARFEQWADTLDPSDFKDASDLRAIAQAADAVKTAEARLREAVEVARKLHGRSWGLIGIMLGVSRQAARERFGEKVRA